MKFGDKLKALRKQAGLSQPALAKMVGVTVRTICNYEAGTIYPRKHATYVKLAEVLNTSVSFLVSEEEEFETKAYAQYGKRGLDQARALAEEFRGLCAGGELDDEDLDSLMKAMQEAYWEAKEVNKRHIPKKYRRNKVSEDKTET